MKLGVGATPGHQRVEQEDREQELCDGQDHRSLASRLAEYPARYLCDARCKGRAGADARGTTRAYLDVVTGDLETMVAWESLRPLVCVALFD